MHATFRFRFPVKSLLALLLLAASLLGGCAPAEKLPRFVWPPPPEQPRLEFIGIYASQNDFPKTAFQRFIRGFAGDLPPAGFMTPVGIVADSKGKAFISDFHLRNLRVYDFNERTVNFFLEKSDAFSAPLGMAIDSKGNLYIADGGKKQVMVFSAGGRPLFSFGGRELLENPAYLAINERVGRIYVSDGRGHKIAVFDMDGRHLFNIGGEKFGNAPGFFHAPQGMAIDKEDRLFVCDMLNSRIQVFDVDGSYLYDFGERGDTGAAFDAPKDVAIDSDGNLHILDVRSAAVKTFSPDGTFLLLTGGGRTDDKFGFAKPTSIFIDDNDRIYITDGLLNRRFSVWQYFGESYRREHPFTEADREELLQYMEKVRKEREAKEQ